MNQGSYIFSQHLGYVPKDVFDRIVKKYNGNKYVKSFSYWNQFCVMVYAQLAPLRDFFEAGRKWQFATDDPTFEGLQLMLNF